MTVEDTVAIAEARVRVANGDLVAIRTRARLSQNAIAGAVGVNRVAVLRWERGERLPTGEPAIRLAKLLRDLEKVAAKNPRKEVLGSEKTPSVGGLERRATTPSSTP